MRPIINTEKHYVQQSLFTIASGAILIQTFAQAVADVSATNATHVHVGSKISAVYIEMWLTSDADDQSTAIVTLEKQPNGVGSMSVGEAAALFSYDNKSNVLHTQMGLFGPNTQVPMASIKGWFKIPKGKQRMALGDKLRLNIFGQSNGLAGCGFMLYKEQQ